MPLIISKASLASRQIRQQIASGSNSIRKVTVSHPVTTSTPTNPVLDFLGNAFGGAFNGFISVFKGLNFGNMVSSSWGWLVGRVEQLKSFNWNATDKDLAKLADNQNLAIAAAWGTALGGAVGWLAGIGIGYGVSFLCPVIGGASLARTVSKAVGIEAVEEITSGLTGAISATVGALANQGLISTYINYRKLVKTIPAPILDTIYGVETSRFIREQWGKEGQPNLSFNEQMDDFVENIQNDKLKVFVENFLEESYDTFCEAGYIVAMEIDTAYAQNKAASQTLTGKPKTVKLKPNKKIKGEVITLQANSIDLESEVQQTLIAHRLVANRDLGQLVGMPAEEWYRAKTHKRMLVVIFRGKETPPYRLNGKRVKEITASIPDVKAGLSWAEIKLACKKFTTGKFRATANLDNGRQMAVYGASAKEAEKKLKELMTLSTAKIITLSTSEEVLRNPKLKKEPVLVYPSYATLLVRRPSVELTGKTDLEGNTWEEEHIRIDLWVDTKPSDFKPLK